MNLKRLFQPRSVAIVGVSQNTKKVGYLVAKNMVDQGYSGDLYFVNPKGYDILGKKCLKSISELDQEIDLFVLATPALVSIKLIDEIVANGSKNIVLFAAGLGEGESVSDTNPELQLREKINDYGLNLLGPNCIGYINTSNKVNATFFNNVAPEGNIGMVSQSGAIGTALLDYVSTKTNLGFSYFISLGNKISINELDCLEYLSKDKNTKVIGMYLEDIKDGKKFIDILSETTKKKSVVILKSGRTKAGSEAAMSHTGSMVGDDQVFDSAIKQSGAVRADSYAEFEMLLKLYSLEAIPKNDKVLVLSNAGGMGVLLADEIVANKLSLVNLSKESMQKLSKAFESIKKITVHNPIDLLGDASSYEYEKAINLTMEEKDIGSVVVLLTPQANTEVLQTAKVLEKVYKKFKYKPLYPIFMGKKSVSQAHKYLESKGIASFRYFAFLPKILSKILNAKKFAEINQPSVISPVYKIKESENKKEIDSVLLSKSQSQRFMNQEQSLSILESVGIETAKTYLAVSREDLKTVEKKLGYPLVAKIASDKITHKTEVKGVITGITVYEELENAFNSFKSFGKDTGCYLQRQFEGHELILGAKRDKTFGVTVLVGLGGIYAELIKETIEFNYPFSFDQFKIKISESKIQKLTEHFRNMPKINIKKLYEQAILLGLILSDYNEIKEIDINPLIITENEPIAVDARVIYK